MKKIVREYLKDYIMNENLKDVYIDKILSIYKELKREDIENFSEDKLDQILRDYYLYDIKLGRI
jgi:hypothetical protein